MPTTKVSMIFGYTSGTATPAVSLPFGAGAGRDAGWTESWYTSLAPNTTQITAAIGRLALARGALLSAGISIGPCRVQSVDPVGPAFLIGRYFNNPGGTNQDIPQMCLAQRMVSSTTRNRFTLLLRGLPDARSALGVYNPSNAFNTALRAYFDELLNWSFRGQDFSAETRPVQSIDTNGVYILSVASAFVSGQSVKVLRTVDSSGRQVSQTCQITVTTASTGVLANWQLGPTRAGNMRLVKPAFYVPIVLEEDMARVSIRKVGRPLEVYRGRVSARRS